MVQNAIREAARLGLVTIEERRRQGRRNLPNVVWIISKEWTMWLARGGRSSRPQAESLIGCKKVHPTAAWCTDHGCGRTDPYPVRGQARRTELGRPSSSM
jgi:hypothetical protein